MRIVTFASGSTGNCSLVSDGEANILIDAGISMRRTVSALKELGLSPQDYAECSLHMSTPITYRDFPCLQSTMI